MSSDLWYGEAWTLPVGNSKQDTKNSARVKQQQRLYVSRDLSERNGEIAHWKKHDPIFHMQGWEGRIQKWNKRGGKGKKPQQDSRHEGTAETKLLLGLLNMMLKEWETKRDLQQQWFSWGRRNYFTCWVLGRLHRGSWVPENAHKRRLM